MSYTNTRAPIIMYCLGLFVVVYSKQNCLQTEKYDVAQVVIDMYIPTKFHVFISFGFRVTLVEEDDDDDKQNSLS